MSYCGACGSFYFPECPRRRDGVCSPAANPFEVRLSEIAFLTTMAQIAVAAMQAENAAMAARGSGPAFDKEAFLAAADKLRKEVGDLK